jgi:hypothetical protein
MFLLGLPTVKMLAGVNHKVCIFSLPGGRIANQKFHEWPRKLVGWSKALHFILNFKF